MRLHIGALPRHEELEPETPWRPVSEGETSIWKWQLKAFPVALMSAATVLAGWVLLTPAEQALQNVSFPLPILEASATLLGVLVVHECVHALLHPGMGCSERTVAGFWPSRMLLYVTYRGEVSRRRYVAVLLAPLFSISLVPLTVSAVLGIQSFWMVYASVANAFVASGDVLSVRDVLKAPTGAVLRMRGISAYWRV